MSNFFSRYKNLFKKNLNKGFTLLELLIVVGIIGVLAIAIVLVLNPGEAIKKSRDTQRMSDLNTLKKVLGIYAVSNSYPKMAGIDNSGCKGTAFGSEWQLDSDYIYYSYPSDGPGAPITGKSLDGVTFTTGGAKQVTNTNLAKNDGTGWLPINFTSLSGGSPISVLPVDPVNTIADPANPTSTDLVYRYVCSEQNLTYELGATLESEAYTVTDNKMATDGGNNNNYYEAGTGLALMNEEGSTIVEAQTIQSVLNDMIPLVASAYSTAGDYSTACASVADLITTISGLGGTTECYSNNVPADVYLRWGASVIVGTSAPIEAYSVSSNGVTTWDTQGVDSSGSFVGTDVVMNWDTANTACSTAGGRLPTLEELQAFRNATFAASGIYTPPNFVASRYWSGTTTPPDPNSAYYVYMSPTGIGKNIKTTTNSYVRCVR